LGVKQHRRSSSTSRDTTTSSSPPPVISYNKPRRRQALLEIRRLIVDEGLSHNEIQLRLNLPPSTYFRYLDILFKAEHEAISGNNYTYQRLLSESLILNQRYLRRARKLTEIADDETVDAKQRIEAHKFAAELERAVHDMSYMAPSYLRKQGLLPEPKTIHPALTMSRIEDEEQDPSERERMEVAGEFRRQHRQQQQISNPLAYTEDTYHKIQKNKKKLEEEQEQDELDGSDADEFGEEGNQ
jgi:hypothetical protein